MKEIKLDGAMAPKLQGTGKIKYTLWVDDNLHFYVQLLENVPEEGSFTKCLFSVSKYGPDRHKAFDKDDIVGLDPVTYKEIKVEGNNDSGFLRAALLHLLG